MSSSGTGCEGDSGIGVGLGFAPGIEGGTGRGLGIIGCTFDRTVAFFGDLVLDPGPKTFFGSALILLLLCTVQSVLSTSVYRTLISILEYSSPGNAGVVGSEGRVDGTVLDSR